MHPLAESAEIRHARWGLLALLVLTVLVFGRSVMYEFLDWDDTTLVVSNELLNPVTAGHVRTMWTEPVVRLYTPLAYSLWAVAAFAGQVPTADANGVSLNPMVFHALNLLLHLVSVAAVFDLLRRLLPLVHRQDGGASAPRTALAAAFGAAVFAVHPLQVEPVAWISGMNNLLAGALSIACATAYVRSANAASFALVPGAADLANKSAAESSPFTLPSNCAAKSWYVAALFACLLALLSKPSAVVAPAILLAIDALLLRRPARQIARSIAPFALLVVPFVIVAKIAQPAGDVLVPSWPQRVIVAGDAIGFYLHKLVWPAPLLIDYGRRPAIVLATGGSMANWLALAAATFLAAATWRRWRWVTASLMIFVAGLLPVLGLVPFRFQDYSTVADRYAYLPMLGFALLIAGAMLHMKRISTQAIGVILALSLAVASFRQTAVWADTQTLVIHEAAIVPDSLAANTILAYLADRRGDAPAADRYFRAGLAAFPQDPEMNCAYGNFLLHDRPAEAIPHYQAAFRNGLSDPRMINNLGMALMSTGHLPQAIEAFELVLQADPDHLNTLINLGHAYLEMGNLASAEPLLRRALAISPQSEPAARWLSKVQAARRASPDH